MRRSIPNPWLPLAIIGGLAYPPLVYFGLSRLPPGVLVLFGLALIGLRLLGTRRTDQQAVAAGSLALALAGAGLAGLLLLAPALAVLAYPIVISLATAAVFAISLVRPPNVIERIARLREPALSPQGVAYTRRVTIVWTGFLVANAMVSAATAAWGSLSAWTLWNGLISYLLMGILFLGEIGVRHIIRRRDLSPS
jgi:uncharacterized membrane protein